MSLRWKDSRISFSNLKANSFLNTLGSVDAAKIWYPQILFFNTEDKEETKVCLEFDFSSYLGSIVPNSYLLLYT